MVVRAASACLLPTDRKDTGQVSVPLSEPSGWSRWKVQILINSRFSLIAENFECFLFQIDISRFNVNR